MKKRDLTTAWPVPAPVSIMVMVMTGCLVLAWAKPVSAENALKSDLQHALLVSLLAALPAAKASAGVPMDLAISIGYREDNLDWNIAGEDVDVLSELTWKNLAIAQARATARLDIKNDWRIRAEAGYGVITSGANQDSDYNGNNRTLEFSRSNNKAGGNVVDASIGIGRTLRLLDQTVGKFIYVTPVIGLSIHQQNLTITDGVQTIPAFGPFPGLNTTYDAQWQGPWVGVDAVIETGGDMTLIANAEYHMANYSAKANWNLRDDFAHPVSFKHTAKGQGLVTSVGISFPAAKNWTLNAILKYQAWSTRAGSDWVYFSDGSTGYAHLNAVNWESTAYNLEIVHQF